MEETATNIRWTLNDKPPTYEINHDGNALMSNGDKFATYAPPRMTPMGQLPTVFNPADWIPRKREQSITKK